MKIEPYEPNAKCAAGALDPRARLWPLPLRSPDAVSGANRQAKVTSFSTNRDAESKPNYSR